MPLAPLQSTLKPLEPLTGGKSKPSDVSEVLLDKDDPLVQLAADSGIPLKRRRPPVGGTKIAIQAEDYARLGGSIGPSGEPIHDRSPQTEDRSSVPQPPPEEPGILSKIGHTALSGLGVVGNALDLVPSMLRDVATLDNPLDQLLTPFSSENRNTGRDVLTKWGVTAPNDPDKWELADLAGFGLDVASGLPMGALSTGARALTKGGQAARAAGLLDDLAHVAPTVGPRTARMTSTLDDLLKPRAGERIARDQLDMADWATPTPSEARTAAVKEAADAMGIDLAQHADEPLGGLVGVGPVFGQPSRVFGTGERAQQFAGWLDDAAARLKKTAPVRLGRALFDPLVQGRGADPALSTGANVVAADIAEQAGKLKPEAVRTARTMAAEVADNLDEVHKTFDQEFGDAVGKAGGEAVGDFNPGDVVHAADRNNYGRVVGAGKKGAQVQFISPESGATAMVDLPLDQLSKVGGTIADDVAQRATSNVFNRVVRFAAERGGDVGEATGRIIGEGTQASPELTSAIRSVGDDMQTANRAIHEAIIGKGGNTKFLDESDLFEGGMEHLPRYSNPAQQASIARAGGRRAMPTQHAGMKAREPSIERIPTDVVNQLATDPAARGADAADYIANAYRKFLDPNYNGEYPGDFTKQAEDIAAWLSGRPSKEILTQGVLDDFTKYQIGAQTTSRTLDAIHATVMRSMGNEGVPLANAFKKAGMIPEAAIGHLSKLTGESAESLAKRKIPSEVADGIAAVLRPTTHPEWARAIGKAIDGYTQMFKDWVTLPFPAFHLRNLTSGQTNNLVSGNINTAADLATYGKTFKETGAMLKKGVDPKFARELRINNVLHDRGFLDTSILHQGNAPTPASPFAFKDTWRQAAEQTADVTSPLNRVPGMERVRQAAQAAKQTGSNAAENIEFLNRVTMYRYLRKKGYTPAKAAERVNELQFDYSAVSPFERSVMKRMVPFYGFTRKAMPLVLGTLYSQPGGPLAQIVRLTSMATPNTPVPDYIAESTSIPLGTRQSGDKAFLTGLGLVHEDPLQFLGGGARGAGLELLSRTNPLIKAPLEWATGTSFFQHGAEGGRDLSDLDPPIGRTLANIVGKDEPVTFPGSDVAEFIVSNTPATRAVSTIRTLTDPRKDIGSKAVNLATGLRISDVSPASQDKVLRDRAYSLMKQLGARSWREVYFGKEQLAAMPPEQRAAADELRGLIGQIEKRSKQRKAAKLLATGEAG